MKKLTLLFLMACSIGVNAQTKNYSLEMESQLYQLKMLNDDARFCKDSYKGQNMSDVVGVQVIEATCSPNYFSFNLIQKWGEEIYNLAMKNPKNPSSYKNYAFPFGNSANEKLMAYSILKDDMFWTSVDRYGEINPKTKKNKKIEVTEGQYKFFKEVFEKLKNGGADDFKPHKTVNLNLSKVPFEQLSRSKTYVNYAQSLVINKKESDSIASSLDVVFGSYQNYKAYLDFIYEDQMSEFTKSPKSFKKHKFTPVQCAALKIALTKDEFEKNQKEVGFSCDKK